MTDLTEQWKKGKLPEGEYYVKTFLNKKTTERYFTRGGFEHQDVKEVLARVPSYTELQSMNEAVNQAMAANIKLVEKVKQLKETNEALEAELKEVCDVLIRKCPEMKEWVMLNWKNLYEVQDE